MKKSPLDEVFFELYGYYPNKAGQAFEMMATAAFKLIGNSEVEYDQRVKGEYSKTVYQLDGIIKSDSTKSMLEAKDYSIDNRKVGRGDIQKFQGALTDLDIDQGIFVSATEFTTPAKKYAESSLANPSQKEIQLYHIRPSTEEDEKGILKKVSIKLIIWAPNLRDAKYDFVLTQKTQDDFKREGYISGYFTHLVSEIYAKDGSVLISIDNLIKSSPPQSIDEEDFSAKATWVLKDGYFKLNDKLYSILGISYKIPFSSSVTDFVVESDGSFKIYIRNESDESYKLITDEDFKKIKFLDGVVEKEKELFDI